MVMWLSFLYLKIAPPSPSFVIITVPAFHVSGEDLVARLIQTDSPGAEAHDFRLDPDETHGLPLILTSSTDSAEAVS